MNVHHHDMIILFVESLKSSSTSKLITKELKKKKGKEKEKFRSSHRLQKNVFWLTGNLYNTRSLGAFVPLKT